MRFEIRKIFLVVISALIMTVAGCRANPVLNIEEASVITTKSQASADEVKNAILLAGKSLGWIMKPAGPGSILGTLNLRKHMAVVDIKYSTKTYSIIYKNSQNLDYDGTNIHGNYNGWVQRLNQAIQVQLNGV